VALGQSDRRVGELVHALGRPQNLVSYHLKILRSSGLVRSRRSSADGRDVYYRVDLARSGAMLDDAAALLGQVGLARPSGTPVDQRRRSTVRRPRVLFVCMGNSARSQIAEAMMNRRSQGRVVAFSGGARPKPIHPNAALVLRERGIDISGRSSKPLTRYARSRFDRVVTLCDRVREICPPIPGAVHEHWSIADPAAAGDTDTATYPAFAAAADEIDERVTMLLARLTGPSAAVGSSTPAAVAARRDPRPEGHPQRNKRNHVRS
jgi:protein-tyrosine-phosphatase/DNA-binding transcriptional ArsR family regulator